MAIYGYVWLCMVMYGYIWVLMVIFGYVWLCISYNTTERAVAEIHAREHF